MAQTKRGTTADRLTSRRRTNQRDKIAKAEMSREMLAAGLAAAAAAISASPTTRRKIRDAGLDAADTAQAAASTAVSSASKLGSLIAEAVADAAQRATAQWDAFENHASGQASSSSGHKTKKTASRQATSGSSHKIDKKSREATSGLGREIHVTITEGVNVSESFEAQLVCQVEAMMAQSGGPADFNASKWVHDWIRHEVPALEGKRPIDLLDNPGGRARVCTTLAQMQSGAYA